MAATSKVGDHVSWNSEAGQVSGTIIKVHTTDFDYKGYTHHASQADPQYEIKSSKTGHIAAHKGQRLGSSTTERVFWATHGIRVFHYRPLHAVGC
jgi:hypothetical protein